MPTARVQGKLSWGNPVRFATAVDAAERAFWDAVVAAYPEAEPSQVSLNTSLDLCDSMLMAMREAIGNGHRRAKRAAEIEARAGVVKKAVNG